MSESFRPLTQRGYDFYEVTSAFQKSVRLGLDEDAAYWAVELIPKFEQYFWRRAKIIANEDIGVSNPAIFPILEALERQYFQARDLLMVVNAAILMARSQKTRLACHLSIVLEQQISQGLPKREIPDYALDCHTARGKRMGRTVQDHFRNVGATINNEAEVGDRWEEECYRLLKTEKRHSLGTPAKPATQAPAQAKCGTGQLFSAPAMDEDPGPEDEE
jgi:replication-associated recombination protein RarA